VTVATERIVAESKRDSVPTTPKEFADTYLRSKIHEQNERELEEHLASPDRARQTENFKEAVEMEKAKVCLQSAFDLRDLRVCRVKLTNPYDP
jgi:hypothetical protein